MAGEVGRGRGLAGVPRRITAPVAILAGARLPGDHRRRGSAGRGSGGEPNRHGVPELRPGPRVRRRRVGRDSSAQAGAVARSRLGHGDALRAQRAATLRLHPPRQRRRSLRPVPATPGTDAGGEPGRGTDAGADGSRRGPGLVHVGAGQRRARRHRPPHPPVRAIASCRRVRLDQSRTDPDRPDGGAARRRHLRFRVRIPRRRQPQLRPVHDASLRPHRAPQGRTGLRLPRLATQRASRLQAIQARRQRRGQYHVAGRESACGPVGGSGPSPGPRVVAAGAPGGTRRPGGDRPGAQPATKGRGRGLPHAGRARRHATATGNARPGRNPRDRRPRCCGSRRPRLRVVPRRPGGRGPFRRAVGRVRVRRCRGPPRGARHRGRRRPARARTCGASRPDGRRRRRTSAPSVGHRRLPGRGGRSSHRGDRRAQCAGTRTTRHVDAGDDRRAGHGARGPGPVCHGGVRLQPVASHDHTRALRRRLPAPHRSTARRGPAAVPEEGRDHPRGQRRHSEHLPRHRRPGPDQQTGRPDRSSQAGAGPDPLLEGQWRSPHGQR